MSRVDQPYARSIELDATNNQEQGHDTVEQPASYSVFTKGQKGVIVVFVTLAGIFSPLTAYVYFPGLRTISEAFGVNLEAMNLTVTAYLIVQAIAPAMLADTSEKLGRRPAYLLAMTVYCAASIGLIFQRNYAALLVLRMLQSAGSSPTVSLAFGCIGDIAAPHERGSFVGASHVGFNIAPALGPVLGGVITEKAGWPYIFVLLAALSGLLLIFMLCFFHETSRTVVDNGSKPPPTLNMTLKQLLSKRKSTATATRPRFSPPKILPCFAMIFHKDTFPLLAAYSVFYMMYSVLQATTAPLFESIYGLTPLQAGLCYLAYGVAGGTASHALGVLADRDYRITAKQHNFAIDYRHGDDLATFPIEKARLRSIFVYVPVCSSCTIAYGWTLTTRTHLAVPIILQFVIGFTVIGVFNMCNTLLTDTHPDSPVTAVASANIARCLVAAGGVAAVQPLIEATNPGWAFTIIGLLCWSMILLLYAIRCKGWQWRKSQTRRAQSTGSIASSLA